MFSFQCKDCDCFYEELTKFDKKGKYTEVVCPKCQSVNKTKLLTNILSVTFKEPKGTSKEDNFDYVAKRNYEMAQKTREIAEKKSHMGKNPYNDLKF